MRNTKSEIMNGLQGVDNSGRYHALYERLAERLAGKHLDLDTLMEEIVGTVRFWLTCTPLSDEHEVNSRLLPQWLIALTPTHLLPEMRRRIVASFPLPD